MIFLVYVTPSRFQSNHKYKYSYNVQYILNFVCGIGTCNIFGSGNRVQDFNIYTVSFQPYNSMK